MSSQITPNKQQKSNPTSPLKALKVKRLTANGRKGQKLQANQKNRRSPRRAQNPRKQGNDYHHELSNFIQLRHSAEQPSTSTSVRPIASTIPSHELIWIKDESEPHPLSSILETFQPKVQDDEIEDGEIVESEVAEEVNDLLEESFPVLERSRQVVDLSLSQEENIFFEDRTSQMLGTIPKYNTFGKAEDTKVVRIDSSDDVICLDVSQAADDSVIFVSEEKLPLSAPNQPAKLLRPDFLNTPVLNSLYNLVPRTSTPFTIKPPPSRASRRAPQRTTSPQKKMRNKLYHQKKALELAKINTGNGKKTPQVKEDPKPSTSGEQLVTDPALDSPAAKEEEKRIVLIDGSNIAMAFTDNYGVKKTDKDFSAEGLKIAIDYFVDKGFQVKAIVPEYRVRRDKSSNHELMTELKETGKLVLTPSKSYDDRVILESALKLDAAVVSNDHFRDLLLEKPQFQEVVSRLIRFNWLFHKLIIPEDPHGRDGPKLDEILFKKPS